MHTETGCSQKKENASLIIYFTNIFNQGALLIHLFVKIISLKGFVLAHLALGHESVSLPSFVLSCKGSFKIHITV